MALSGKWVDKINGVDMNNADDINQVANAVIELEGKSSGGISQETDPTVPSWAKQPSKPAYTASEVGALPSSTKIPAKTSDLTNDSGFITKAITDLANYYTKSQTYTRDELNALISAIPKFSISVVSSLPTSNISATTIYLVGGGSGDDLYTEYIYTNGKWEILGSQKVDLTGYATQSWTNAQLADYIKETELGEAINSALEQAKESGEFDGSDGRGIKSIVRTSGTGAAGTTDTYTITYTDNTTSTFTVYNGENGTNGTSVTVSSVSESAVSGGTNTVTFSDGKKINIKNGADGKDYVLTDADRDDIAEKVGGYCVSKNQGSANAGKILVVGADGNLTLTDMPEGGGGYDVNGTLQEGGVILLSGDLPAGTYVFKFDNTDGTYADIGSHVVGGVVEYSITATLTNCSGASGNATVIKKNGTVTLTFTANDGFALTETVEVSGAAYTWDASTGTLVLSEPTADVTITITATKSGYTNIIDTVGYTDNLRLSSSDGSDRPGATGYTTTGMIVLPNNGVLRTRGVNYTNATYNTAFIHRFNASTNAYIAAYKDTQVVNGLSFVNDGSGNLTITNTTGGDVKLRLTGYGSGANLIVTIDEEITD